MEHGLDDEYGGFKGTVSRDGEAVKPFEKGLIGQSRFLWSFATLRETGELGPEADPLMEDLYTFLVEHFLNDSDSLFCATSSLRPFLFFPIPLVLSPLLIPLACLVLWH